MKFDDLPVGNLASLYYDDGNPQNQGAWRILKTSPEKYKTIEYVHFESGEWRFSLSKSNGEKFKDYDWSDMLETSEYELVDEGKYMGD